MTSLLRDLFTDKLLTDDRQPAFSFTLNTGGANTKTYQIDFLLPQSALYVQFGLLFLLTMIFAALVGAVVYRTIVIPQEQNKENPLSSFLVAFGVLIPLCVGLPFWLMDYFDVRSRAVRFGTMGAAATGARIMATLDGFTPDYATSSQTNMMLHYGALLELKWDEKTKKPIPGRVMDGRFLSHLWNGAITICFMGFLFSWLGPYDYHPFPTEVNPSDFIISLDANHLANTFWCAVILSTFLNSGSHMIGAFFPLLMGYEAELLVDNPMFLSNCPSDFWGRRWNSLGHILLKRGFYKPARKLTNSPMVGALAAFVASGIIHEWVSYVLFHTNSHQPTPKGYHFPVFGKQMGFFGWNGILVILEYIVVANGIAKAQRQWMSQHLPKVAVGIFVVITALPTGHWMTGDMVHLGFCRHLSLGFPKIVVTAVG